MKKIIFGIGLMRPLVLDLVDQDHRIARNHGGHITCATPRGKGCLILRELNKSDGVVLLGISPGRIN